MKISTFFSLLCLLFFATISYGQDMRPGYIVNNSGDTTRGFVGYQQTSTKTCAFATDKNVKPTDLRASDLRGYGFDDDLSFISTKINNEARFVEVVVPGRATLFAIENYFGVVKNDTVVLLEPKSKSVIVNGTAYEREDRTAISHLATLLSDAKKNLAYDQITIYGSSKANQEKRLAELVTQYNASMGGPITRTRQTKKTKGIVDLTLLVGASTPQFKGAGDSDIITNADYSSEISPQATFLIQYTYPSVSDKLSIFTGISFYKTSFEGYYAKTDAKISADFHEIKWPFGFRYQFTRTTIRPYIKAGLSICMSLSDEYLHYNDEAYTDPSDAIWLKPHGTTFFLSAGATRKLAEHHAVSAELGWDTGSNILNKYIGFSLLVRYPSLMIGYSYRL